MKVVYEHKMKFLDLKRGDVFTNSDNSGVFVKVENFKIDVGDFDAFTFNRANAVSVNGKLHYFGDDEVVEKLEAKLVIER